MLAKEILMNGFLTGHDALWVIALPSGISMWPQAPWGPLPAQIIGYVKGCARSTTLLALLSIMLKSAAPIENMFPGLVGSFTKIFCYVPKIRSQKDVMMANFKRSV